MVGVARLVLALEQAPALATTAAVGYRTHRMAWYLWGA